jgi:hypothetical protein
MPVVVVGLQWYGGYAHDPLADVAGPCLKLQGVQLRPCAWEEAEEKQEVPHRLCWLQVGWQVQREAALKWAQVSPS